MTRDHEKKHVQAYRKFHDKWIGPFSSLIGTKGNSPYECLKLKTKLQQYVVLATVELNREWARQDNHTDHAGEKRPAEDGEGHVWEGRHKEKYPRIQ